MCLRANVSIIDAIPMATNKMEHGLNNRWAGLIVKRRACLYHIIIHQSQG